MFYRFLELMVSLRWIQLRFWKLFCFKFYIYIFLMCDFLQVVGWNMYKAAKDFRNSAEFFKWPYFLVLLQVLQFVGFKLIGTDDWHRWSAPTFGTNDRHCTKVVVFLFFKFKIFSFWFENWFPKHSLEKLNLKTNLEISN